MRTSLWICGVALLFLAGCKREPDFDTRYKAAQERIDKSAKEIDAEIRARTAGLETDSASDAANENSQ